MERLPDNCLLKFHSNTLDDVRKIYDLDKDKIKQSIDSLQEWLKKQNHFTKVDFDRNYIERMLIATKGSVERAKERLDKACTLRGLMPHFFQDFDIRNDFIFFNNGYHVMLPQLTKNHERVFVSRNVGKNVSSKLFLDAYKFIIMICEYTRLYDYARSYHIIFDYRDANMMEYMSKVDIVELRQVCTLIIEAYGVRVKGIHLLMSSKFIDAVVALAKQVAPAKIGKRIQTHKTLESLHEVISKDILPSEYGGVQKSVAEIRDDWVEALSSQKFKEYWREMNGARTDESLRTTDKFNEQYMGMPGTFRTLIVD